MQSKIDKKIENALRKKVEKILAEDKSEWTLYHTLRVVYWIKKLIKNEGGNEKILIPAAYLHDIGYVKTDIGKREKMDKVYSKKFEHMKLGEKIARGILSEFSDYFTEEEIKTICDLVGKHDIVEFKDVEVGHDFQLLIEADSLGGIDPSLKPTFSKEDIIKYLEYFKKVRVSLFKTKTGKRYLNEIYPKTLSKWLKEK